MMRTQQHALFRVNNEQRAIPCNGELFMGRKFFEMTLHRANSRSPSSFR
jgi:hypothetical protein